MARSLRIVTLAAVAGVWPGEPLARPGPAAPVVLWAWQRPEDLSFADPLAVSVAYLSETARISPSGLEVTGRRQPLRVSAGTQRVPVVRIEVPHPMEAGGLERHHEALIGIVTSVAAGASVVQIDFDARQSERAFYAELLRGLRARLPHSTRLSITALASWCFGDRWIGALPVDEAVPMLFRMGLEGPALRARLADGDDFPVEVCRSAYGLSTDEPAPPLRAGRTVYVFHPRPWSRAAYDGARSQLREAGQP